MKKNLALVLALIFGVFATGAYAAEGVALTNDEMDEIAAGDWVILEEGQTVEDVWYSNNDIKLNDESQMDIQAVANTNSVDSANAVQTNISSASGEVGVDNAITGYNEANLLNYTPSDESSSYYNTSSSSLTTVDTSSTSNSAEAFSLVKVSSSSASASASYGLTETLDIVETLDAAAAYAASGEVEEKGGESEFVEAAVAVLDYDYNLDYDKNESASASASASENCSLVIGATSSSSSSSSSKTSSSSESSSASGSYARKNLSENNHIDLEDTAQRNIQAVSNLNSVGSAAAVQTNIASNLMVSGSINHTNIATAVNGL